MADIKTNWNPEDSGFWEKKARRLPIEILDFHPQLVVWIRRFGLLGVITVQMLNLGFPFCARFVYFDGDCRFDGATLRIPSSFLSDFWWSQHHLFTTAL